MYEYVEKYLKWQTSIYKGWIKVEDRIRKEGLETLKVIRFEDLILDYEKTITDVFDFLSIN